MESTLGGKKGPHFTLIPPSLDNHAKHIPQRSLPFFPLFLLLAVDCAGPKLSGWNDGFILGVVFFFCRKVPMAILLHFVKYWKQRRCSSAAWFGCSKVFQTATQLVEQEHKCTVYIDFSWILNLFFDKTWSVILSNVHSNILSLYLKPGWAIMPICGTQQQNIEVDTFFIPKTELKPNHPQLILAKYYAVKNLAMLCNTSTMHRSTVVHHSWLDVFTHWSLVQNDSSEILIPVKGENMFDICYSMLSHFTHCAKLRIIRHSVIFLAIKECSISCCKKEKVMSINILQSYKLQ